MPTFSPLGYVLFLVSETLPHYLPSSSFSYQGRETRTSGWRAPIPHCRWLIIPRVPAYIPREWTRFGSTSRLIRVEENGGTAEPVARASPFGIFLSLEKRHAGMNSPRSVLPSAQTSRDWATSNKCSGRARTCAATRSPPCLLGLPFYKPPLVNLARYNLRPINRALCIFLRRPNDPLVFFFFFLFLSLPDCFRRRPGQRRG